MTVVTTVAMGALALSALLCLVPVVRMNMVLPAMPW